MLESLVFVRFQSTKVDLERMYVTWSVTLSRCAKTKAWGSSLGEFWATVCEHIADGDQGTFLLTRYRILAVA